MAAGTPFRDAHAIVGEHVRRALDGEGSFADLVAADERLGPDAAASSRDTVSNVSRPSPGCYETK